MYMMELATKTMTADRIIGNQRAVRATMGNLLAKLNAKTLGERGYLLLEPWSRSLERSRRAERARSRAKDKVGGLNRQSNCLRKIHFCGRFHLRQNLFFR